MAIKKLMFYTRRMKNKAPNFTNSYVESVKQEYDENGYYKFTEVIPRDEALALGVELQQLIEGRNTDVQWEKSDKSKVFDMHDVHRQSNHFEALRHDPRILARLAILLGGPVVYHHNKGFVKPRAKGDTYGGTFPPHQDYPFFMHSNDKMLAAIVYMTDITEDMGPVRVFQGSHKNGPLETLEGKKYLDDTSWPPENAVTMTGNAGDIVAFNVNTVHMSGPNKSLFDRVSWLIQVNHPSSVPPVPNIHPSLDQGEVLWPAAENE